MKLLPKVFKTFKSYEDDVVSAIFNQTGIFSYEAKDGVATINFSAVECMHYWEIRVPIGELLNFFLKNCEFDNLLVFSEIGDDIAHAMKASAIHNGGRKRNIYTLIEKPEGFAIQLENSPLVSPIDIAPRRMIMIENSAEKIKKALEIENASKMISEIMFLFGSSQEFEKLSGLAHTRGILVLRVLPLELLVSKYLKIFF